MFVVEGVDSLFVVVFFDECGLGHYFELEERQYFEFFQGLVWVDVWIDYVQVACRIYTNCFGDQSENRVQLVSN